jgi:hypothetical protein
MLVDILDCFPIQIEVLGHIGRRHFFAKLVNCLGKMPSHPLVWIEKAQVFYRVVFAGWAPDLAVFAVQMCPSRCEIQIPY